MPLPAPRKSRITGLSRCRSVIRLGACRVGRAGGRSGSRPARLGACRAAVPAGTGDLRPAHRRRPDPPAAPPGRRAPARRGCPGRLSRADRRGGGSPGGLVDPAALGEVALAIEGLSDPWGSFRGGLLAAEALAVLGAGRHAAARPAARPAGPRGPPSPVALTDRVSAEALAMAERLDDGQVLRSALRSRKMARSGPWTGSPNGSNWATGCSRSARPTMTTTRCCGAGGGALMC